LSALPGQAQRIAGNPLGTQHFTGFVLDANTGDSIALASVVYKGRQVSAVSDLQGYFSIVRYEGEKLTFSAVGYESRTITVGSRRNMIVRLKPSVQQLQGVTIRHKRGRYSRKNNPAVEMMKKVIAAKKRTNLKERPYYQYDRYQKLVLALNDITPAALDSPKFKKKPWLIQQIEPCPYNNKLILPVSVEETVSQQLYRKSPHDEKTIIKGERQTGVNELLETGDILNVVMKDVFTDINLYDDQIRMLQYYFTSPIGKDAIDFYRFYIIDTVKVDRDSCFHLHFLPNNQQDVGFRGDLYVLSDSSFQVKRCEMTLPKQTSVNFVKNMKINQEFTRLEDGTWVLSVDDMFTELTVLLQSLAVVRNTRLSGYAFDELPKQLFKGKRTEVHDANSRMRNDAFWAQYRQVELTKSESQMGVFVDGLKQIKGFKYFIIGLQALIENTIETSRGKKPSKFDITPVNTIISRNFIDGWRTRIGGTTTANLDSMFFLSGYYARGWKSHHNYYKAEAQFSLNKKEYSPWEFPQRTLSVLSTYDVQSPTDRFLHTDKDNFLVAFKWTTVDKMMFYNRQQVTFDFETLWGLRATLQFKAEENQPVGSLYFVPLSESGDRSRWTNWSHPVPEATLNGAKDVEPVSSSFLRTTEVRAQLQFSPGQTYINTKQRRRPINLDAPVFTLSHTTGFQGILGGEVPYNYSEASVYKRFWLNSWGKLDLRAKAGIQWSQVPFPLLCLPETNLSIIIQERDRFQLINNMEFLNDRFLSFMVGWDLNGKLFNRIPLIKKLKCREFFSVKCMWGDLSNKNNPFLPENAGNANLMYFPETSFVMDNKTPYVEVSVGIHNIFKILQIEYVRRLTYLNLPTAHKQGVRFTMVMSF